MFRQAAIIFSILFVQIMPVCHADKMLVDANILYAMPDAGGSDDFNLGKIASINYNYYYRPWLALTAGAFISDEIIDAPKTDIVGTYQTFIETYGLTLGMRPEHVFSERNKIYARAGVLYYDTTLSVEEYFEAGVPAGTTSSKTNGYGYFIAAAWSHSFTKSVSFQLELSQQKQLSLFEGKTTASNVFDLSFTGISIGVGYAF